MSENLPLEMQLEIMKRLPVKSLIQFRSVSKLWYSVITTSDFIHSYNKAHHTLKPHLLVRYEVALSEFNFKDTFVSIVDDKEQEVSFPNPIVPPVLLLKMLNSRGRIIGCSDGLLCICDSSFDETQKVAVIWNIAIRKEVAVVLYNVGEEEKYRYDLGFGVCPETSDPTIVKIKRFRTDTESLADVEVFKLSTGAWRSLDSSNLPPRISLQFSCQQVEGCLYWLASERITLYFEDTYHNMILSFDMKSEEFNQVKLPGTLAHKPEYNMSLSKIRESLVVCEEVDDITFSIWMMEDDVPNLFTKLFTLRVNVNGNVYRYASVKGFRYNGEPIVEIPEDVGIYKLVVCDPYSKRIDSFGIKASKPVIEVHCYKETLLMLDQPNLKVYNQLENRS